jgi:hypothetical protein
MQNHSIIKIKKIIVQTMCGVKGSLNYDSYDLFDSKDSKLHKYVLNNTVNHVNP